MVINMEESEIREALKMMERDLTLKSGSSFSTKIDLYPDNQIPFVEKHLAYLKANPKLNPEHYLANLRIMIKIRP
jgi:hypothetical protein